jgi:hypothetical protein
MQLQNAAEGHEHKMSAVQSVWSASRRQLRPTQALVAFSSLPLHILFTRLPNSPSSGRPHEHSPARTGLRERRGDAQPHPLHANTLRARPFSSFFYSRASPSSVLRQPQAANDARSTSFHKFNSSILHELHGELLRQPKTSFPATGVQLQRLNKSANLSEFRSCPLGAGTSAGMQRGIRQAPGRQIGATTSAGLRQQQHLRSSDLALLPASSSREPSHDVPAIAERLPKQHPDAAQPDETLPSRSGGVQVGPRRAASRLPHVTDACTKCAIHGDAIQRQSRSSGARGEQQQCRSCRSRREPGPRAPPVIAISPKPYFKCSERVKESKPNCLLFPAFCFSI